MIKRRGAEMSDPLANPDATYVMSRAEDRSVLMRMSYTYDKYRPIVVISGFFLIAAGFGFKTPKATFDEMKAAQKQAADSANVRIARLERLAINMDALIRVKCVELIDKPRDLQLAGIDCTKWMAPVTSIPRVP